MAGMGKRMRPHTLTIPKPLIKIAGKPIVQRLVEEISSVISEPLDEIAYIIGDFGQETEKQLIDIAVHAGAKGSIYYQHQALGTAHAINCAAESLSGNVIIAFADTLFNTRFSLDLQRDGIIWVHKVENPSSFGVVLLDKDKYINGFVEKPSSFVSDLAIVGVYYFKEAEKLRKELEYLLQNNMMKNGEYQLTDALQIMMSKGTKFSTHTVDEWFDCGTKNATIYTNQRILELSSRETLISNNIESTNSIIIEPCFIDEGVNLTNSIIGPHVSIGKDTHISGSIVTNSIIQANCNLNNANIDNSMIGNYVEYKEAYRELNIGDFTVIAQ